MHTYIHIYSHAWIVCMYVPRNNKKYNSIKKTTHTCMLFGKVLKYYNIILSNKANTNVKKMTHKFFTSLR